MLGFVLAFFGLCIVVCFFPFSAIDVNNFIPANDMVTPRHIQPE